MAESSAAAALLHDITLLERKLHGIITQRERLGVNSKEAGEEEGALKKALDDKKRKLRAIMEHGGQPEPPRQPAFIKNGQSLEMLAQIMEIEDKLCSTLPVIEIKPVEKKLYATLLGPTVITDTPDDGAPNYVHYPSSGTPRYSACSLSTYPHVTEGLSAGVGRQGDPICDKFCVQVYKDATVVALADGCNWGRLPFEAAGRSTNAFVSYLESKLTGFTSLRGAGSVLLAALSAANKKIMEGLEQWECGTTTLIGGLLLPILPAAHAPHIGSLPRSNSWSSSNSLKSFQLGPARTRAGSTSLASSLSSSSSSSSSSSANNSPARFLTPLTASSSSPSSSSSSSSKWVFVCVSLGDCKAFHFSQRTQQFTDITEGNRQNLTDARDPGGRLGPYIDADPDLRNLHLYYRVVEPDDFIFLLSDGIHDNLDPQQLGVSPPETKSMMPETWEKAEKIDAEKVESVKNQYRKKWLEDTFLSMKEEDIDGLGKVKLDAKTLTEVLLNHSVNITRTSREFMEKNPKARLPHDFKTYPGKLDHATCVCLSVGTNNE